MTDVRFTHPFKRRLKALAKRYRQIQADIQPIIDQLQAGNFIGDQISGTEATVFKIRAKNSDIPTAKAAAIEATWLALTRICPRLREVLALPGNHPTRRTGEAKGSPQLATTDPKFL